MNTISIKRNLREMKRLEIKTRFGVEAPSRPPLVWDLFFDLQNTGKAKYTLESLESMNRDDYKTVIGEYWSYVVNTLISEQDVHTAHFDTEMLMRWELPYDADAAAVKHRFRELAKRYHPDLGGSAADFIKLMTEYKTLVGQ